LGDPDQVWILAKPIADYLEFYVTNKIKLSITDGNVISFSEFRTYSLQNVPHPIEIQSLFINEKGLYELITKSIKPKARDFQYWIHSEVLPKLRKSGKFEQFGPLNDILSEKRLKRKRCTTETTVVEVIEQSEKQLTELQANFNGLVIRYNQKDEDHNNLLVKYNEKDEEYNKLLMQYNEKEKLCKISQMKYASLLFYFNENKEYSQMLMDEKDRYYDQYAKESYNSHLNLQKFKNSEQEKNAITEKHDNLVVKYNEIEAEKEKFVAEHEGLIVRYNEIEAEKERLVALYNEQDNEHKQLIVKYDKNEATLNQLNSKHDKLIVLFEEETKEKNKMIVKYNNAAEKCEQMMAKLIELVSISKELAFAKNQILDNYAINVPTNLNLRHVFAVYCLSTQSSTNITLYHYYGIRIQLGNYTEACLRFVDEKHNYAPNINYIQDLVWFEFENPNAINMYNVLKRHVAKHDDNIKLKGNNMYTTINPTEIVNIIENICKTDHYEIDV